MLRSLKLQNFTVFAAETFEFCRGLNVIIGENGTGKSQLLKLAYALCTVSQTQGAAVRQSKEELQRAIADKLVAALRPESLGRLVSRQQGRNRCEVGVEFVSPRKSAFAFSFATNSKTEVKVEASPSAYLQAPPVFFPTREMLSVFPGFAAAYRNRELEFDETYYDLAVALEARPLKGKRPANLSALIRDLEELMKGHIVLENGRFYLMSVKEGRGRLEIPLVAEGIRKIAMLAYLLINGALRDMSTLFWDEPEINLHPRLMENLAKSLVALAAEGFQVIMATHSLFLLREIQIQLHNKGKVKARFFSLSEEDGDVRVSAGDTVEDMDPISMLDADLEQTDRYMQLP